MPRRVATTIDGDGGHNGGDSDNSTAKRPENVGNESDINIRSTHPDTQNRTTLSICGKTDA